TMFSGGTTQLAHGLPSVPLPVGFAPVAGFGGAGKTPLAALWLGMPVVICTAAAALIVRLRRARGLERQQLRWFVYVTGLAALTVVLSFLVGNVRPAWIATVSSDASVYGFLVLVPGTIGVAIIGYGLYDIDVFISRALVYGSLAVFITAVYVGIAVGIGTLVGSGGKPNLGLSILATAIVAVGFQPLREHMQRFANRLVYGKRATPYEVLSQFSERVAESYASDEVLPRMARVLAEGTAAELAEVWLRSGESLRRAAAFPVDSPVPARLELNGTETVVVASANRTVEVR